MGFQSVSDPGIFRSKEWFPSLRNDISRVLEGGFKASSDTVFLCLKNRFKVSGKRFFWL